MRSVPNNPVAYRPRGLRPRPLIVALTIAMFAWRAAAQTTRPVSPVAKPTEAVPMASCVTAQCHAEIKDFKVLHGPVNVNACDACHKLTDAARHSFELQRSKTETCTFCHKIDVQDMPVVHKPLQDGQCLSCHNPHGGATPTFTRGRTLAELCNTCHKDVIAGRKTLHGPAAAGACGSCHQSHAAPFPKLLPAQGPDLCLSCHTEMKTQMTQVKFTHKAVEQNCTNCHDPHASDFPRQIRQAPFDMCTSCHEHENIKRQATQSRYKHSIVTADNACLNCHTAHGGDLARLMRAEPIRVCMKCHADRIQVSKDKVVASVAEVLDLNTVKHGPIRDGNCGGCHNVHGSEVARLLSKPYPEPFYQGFSPDKYELCFSCHDKQLVLTQRTEGLTGFRNGAQNLHFVHVNKPERGRNCRACHSTHASSHELHVRDSVPYGNWQMPINFTRTASGGSCAPGCHKAYSYDRENPVQYTSPPTQTPPAPATMPAAPTASGASAAGSPIRGN